MSKIKLLGLSGSLKPTSTNTNILRVIAGFAPDTVELTIFEELESVPNFNPAKEEGNEAVKILRSLTKEANGVIICTPEYAFGMPGALKNALDWLVSSGELNDKPVAAITASPLTSGGDKAMTSLLWTLSALGTKMNEQSSLSIAAMNKKFSLQGELTDEETKEKLKAVLENLMKTIKMRVSE